MRFKDQETYPAASMNLAGHQSETGETVSLGYRESDHHLRNYHFDTDTLENSGLARIIEGTVATPLGIIISLNSLSNPTFGFLDFLTPSRKSRLQELEDAGFSQHDRAVLSLIQQDLLSHGYTAGNPDMVEIEKISRRMGNAPLPGYPALEAESAFKKESCSGAQGFSKPRDGIPHAPDAEIPGRRDSSVFGPGAADPSELLKIMSRPDAVRQSSISGPAEESATPALSANPLSLKV